MKNEPTEENKIVMEDSPEAASIQTVTGWVSRLGHFFGTGSGAERTARYDGSTHKKCEECPAVIERCLIICPSCRHKRMTKKFHTLERKPWDGKTPLAIFDSDTYFFSEDDIDMYCEDHGVNAEDLALVFCTPVKPSQLDANDMFYNELPEDGEVQDDDILAAVDALNKAIAKSDPFSWYPGDVVAVFTAGERNKI